VARNIARAFPILNCVNHPELVLQFRPFQEWIQNYDQFGT
jgi:hypothetical protein